MKTFATVEDYLEIIAGYRDPLTNKATNGHLFFEYQPMVSLARYDVKVLESMANSVATGIALTEKQGELAVKIVLKYQRQLAQKDIDVSPLERPVWRTPLRKMDYSRSLYIKDDKLILRFPYDNTLIEQMRDFSKESQGEVIWDREIKVWKIGLTEYNLSWLYAWTSQLQFTIADDVATLMQRIKDTETNPFAIELTIVNDQLQIKNASDSLHDYIESHVGGFGISNLLRLVDMGSVLGYTIDDDMLQALSIEYGHKFSSLLTNKEIKLDTATIVTSNDLETVISYAEKLNKFPIVIYEPDLSNKLLDKMMGLRSENFMLIKNKKSVPNSFDGFKYIHTVVPLCNISHIPLLISGAGMLFGGDKQLMIQQAEKVVYCATDVYNKKK